jgi:subfamily B ATP-binding cassette protein HlyB/CyaB
MRPETPIDAADLAWAFASLCGLLRVAFDPALFRQQFPPPACAASVHRAGEALGLCFAPIGDALDDTYPFLAFCQGKNTRLALVLAGDANSLLVAERDGAPRRMSRAEYAAEYGSDTFSVTVRAPEARNTEPDVTPKFGLGWFIPELMRHRAVWRDVLVASLVMQIIALAIPLCTQVVIDKVLVHHAQSTLIVIILALALFVAFNAALSYVRQYLLLHAGNRIDGALGLRVFEHLLRLPPRYFEQRPTGTLVARLQGIETIREFVTGAAASVALDAPFVLVFLAIMLWYSVPLTLVALGAIALLAVLSVVLTPLLRRRINRQFLAGARNQAFLTEYVSAMETVKALQLEPQLAGRYGRQLSDYLDASFSTRHLANIHATSAAALEQALAVTVLAAGAWLVMTSDGFTIGMLVAFQMFAARLAQPALRLAGLWQEFQQAAIAVQRLGDLMDAPGEANALRSERCRDRAGRIDIDNVAFAYGADQAAVFDNFSLHVPPGGCVALLGPSGSGKSTLTRLLLGFYFPARGAIRVDGQDTRNLSANELRLQFGVVPQETRLFSGTIADNLVLAQPHAAFDEIVEACRLAEIHDFIQSLPRGYQTVVGENGAGLSGGQKQRIAIARALLRKPRILIFDEATASLDRDTAEALGRTVSRLRGQVTMLFIAHQLPESLQVDATARLEQRRLGSVDEAVVPALEARP